MCPLYLVEDEDPGAGGKASTANHEEALLDGSHALGACPDIQKAALGVTLPLDMLLTFHHRNVCSVKGV